MTDELSARQAKFLSSFCMALERMTEAAIKEDLHQEFMSAMLSVIANLCCHSEEPVRAYRVACGILVADMVDHHAEGCDAPAFTDEELRNVRPVPKSDLHRIDGSSDEEERHDVH